MNYFQKPLSREESDAMAARLEATFQYRDYGLWAVEIPGITPFAGFIGLAVPSFTAHFTPCVEIGWRLAAEYWGNGYATEGAQAVLALAFTTFDFEQIVSFTTAGNHPSRRVMERIGMSYNPADDFDHPIIAAGHPLRRHVLYRARRQSHHPFP